MSDLTVTIILTPSVTACESSASILSAWNRRWSILLKGSDEGTLFYAVRGKVACVFSQLQ